ncbi:MAG: Coenzyme F420 hydrogenase/dehydrogenase, beta subunit C-terminal domain, partial [Chitinispirillaceae bacterium]|nr:Coenzyme F420 hydrogenase/dehydrogenase, beta subunit C-terminal domain [Chitinispirillaceae bacterium]
NKEDILSSSGSIYAPVSSCTVIKEVIEKGGQYAFVGTPCMVEGVTRLEKFFPELKTIIFLKIGIVCSGMASRLSTKEFLLKNIPEPLPNIKKIRYRGHGWPGNLIVYGDYGKEIFTSPYLGENGILKNIVSKDHYLRCNLCFDHMGKYADISVSDPWSKEILKSETKGKSAVLVNTLRGREIIKKTIESNLFEIEEISTEKMISFNLSLIIDKNHPVYGWYQLYNLIFLKKIYFIFSIMCKFFQKRLAGILTLLKAYFNRKYYY